MTDINMISPTEVNCKSSNSSINSSISTEKSTSVYILYHRRWVILFVVFLLNLSNAMVSYKTNWQINCWKN